MFCIKCGAEIESNAKFCTKCGRDLQLLKNEENIMGVDASPKAQIDNQMKTEKPETRQKNLNPIKIIALIFLLGLALIIGMNLSGNLNKNIKNDAGAGVDNTKDHIIKADADLQGEQKTTAIKETGELNNKTIEQSNQVDSGEEYVVKDLYANERNELAEAEKLIEDYNSIRRNFGTLLKQVDNGKLSIYDYLDLADIAMTERQRLLEKTQYLISDSYNPNMYTNMVLTLNKAIDYCYWSYEAGEATRVGDYIARKNVPRA